MTGHLIGIDVGSQSVKVCVLEATGRRLALSSAPCALHFPTGGWAEQDPRQWCEALIRATREACGTAGIAKHEPVTLALACQLDGIVATGTDFAPLRPAIIWMDRRASAQSAALATAVGERRLRQITGLNPDSSHSGPKAMWLRDHEPALYANARWLASVGAYLNGWLTGNVVHDHANASSSLLYSLSDRDWSAELIEQAELDASKLPAIAAAHAPVGRLRPAVAEQLGLSASSVVVCGTGDDHGAALGAGALHPGVLVDVTGTAEPVAAPSGSQLTLDGQGLVETHAHALDGTLLLENPGFVSGGSTRWLAELTGRSQAQLVDAAAAAPLGSSGVTFIPALSGSMAPRWNEQARGCFAGLSLDQGVAHLSRAVLEGCAYALRDIVDRLDELDAGAQEMRVVGGGARSALWLQIKVDVTGRPARRVLGDCATATGAAMLAGVAAGSFADLDQAAACCVELDHEPVLPDPAAHAHYQSHYAAYRELFDQVECWPAAARSAEFTGGTR